MKATVRSYYATQTPTYPNAATRSEVLHKLLDAVLLAASGAAIGAMVLLLLALS